MRSLNPTRKAAAVAAALGCLFSAADAYCQPPKLVEWQGLYVDADGRTARTAIIDSLVAVAPSYRGEGLQYALTRLLLHHAGKYPEWSLEGPMYAFFDSTNVDTIRDIVKAEGVPGTLVVYGELRKRWFTPRKAEFVWRGGNRTPTGVALLQGEKAFYSVRFWNDLGAKLKEPDIVREVGNLEYIYSREDDFNRVLQSITATTPGSYKLEVKMEDKTTRLASDTVTVSSGELGGWVVSPQEGFAPLVVSMQHWLKEGTWGWAVDDKAVSARDSCCVVFKEPGNYKVKLGVKIRSTTQEGSATVMVYEAPAVTVAPVLPKADFSFIPGRGRIAVRATQSQPKDRQVWRLDQQQSPTAEVFEENLRPGNYKLSVEVVRGGSVAVADTLLRVRYWKPPVQWWWLLIASGTCAYGAMHERDTANDTWKEYEINREMDYYSQYTAAVGRQEKWGYATAVTAIGALYFGWHSMFHGRNEELDAEYESLLRLGSVTIKPYEMGACISVPIK